MLALDIKQLSKIYANGVHAVKNIDLSIKTGDFFALLGANGAGKSTTIGLVTTLLNKTSGSIHIHGYDLDNEPENAKSCLGLVPQEINLNIFENCEQILLNQAGYYGIARKHALPRIEALLQQLGLWEKRFSIARHLSGGMKRRLMIARALVHQPKVLILDEPTAGVDIEIRHSMWEFLTRTNAEGTTIILTTHYLEEAEQLCKNIAIIDKGKIIKNSSMKALLQTLRHQTFIFNTETRIDSLSDMHPFDATLIDSTTIELRVAKNLNLNDAFALLSKQGIKIHSMRNKTNRLEELFLDLIKNGH
jgi:ABC-2 type transport system ATP-binding protein